MNEGINTRKNIYVSDNMEQKRRRNGRVITSKNDESFDYDESVLQIAENAFSI